MLLRRVARPLLAAIFVSGGINELSDPESHEKLARPVLDYLTRTVPGADRVSTVRLVQLDGVIKVGAGSLLALGRMPRLSAAALAAVLVPTTLAGHRFWELEDPERRQAEQIHFVKNMGLLGGLLFATADTGGKPSLAWRARHGHGTRWVEQAGERLADRAAETGGRLADRATETGGRLSTASTGAGERLVEAATEVGERLAAATTGAGKRLSEAATGAGERLTDETGRLRTEAELLTSRTARRTRKAGKRARRKLARASKRAGRRAASARAAVGL